MMLRRTILTMLIASILALPLVAGPAFRVAQQGSEWVVENSLPVTVLVLMRGLRGQEAVYKIVEATPRGQVRSGWRSDIASPMVLDAVVLDEKIALKDGEQCGTERLDFSGLSEIAGTIQNAEVSTTQSAIRVVDLTRDKVHGDANIQIGLNDYRAADKHHSNIAGLDDDSLDIYEYQNNEQQIQYERIFGNVAALAAADSAIHDAQREQWQKDAELLEKVVSKLERAEQDLVRQHAASRNVERSGREFGNRAVAAYRKQRKNVLLRPAAARRTCPIGAAGRDSFYIDAEPGTTAASPLAVRLRFDDGTRAEYLALPAGAARDRWRVTMFWPPASRSAQVSAELPNGQTVNCGSVDLSRRSVEEALRLVRQERKKATSKLKEARWVARGGTTISAGSVIQ